jgi:two-component system cell cycle sensor histidine kinase/response regulator CckA
MTHSAQAPDSAERLHAICLRAWTKALAQDDLDSGLVVFLDGVLASFRVDEAEAHIGSPRRTITRRRERNSPSSASRVELPLEHDGIDVGRIVLTMPTDEQDAAIEQALRAACSTIAALVAADASSRPRRDRITEQQQAEGLYRGLVERSNDLVQSVDTKGRILFANASWRRTLGISDVDVTGRSIFDFIHPDSLEHCQTTMHRVFSGEPLQRVDFAFRSPLGNKISVEGDVLPNVQNGVVVATQAFLRRVFAPGENSESAQHRLQILDEAFDGSPEALVFIGVDGLVQRVNEEFTRLFGYTNKEAVGRSIDTLVVPDRLRSEGLDLCRRAGVSEVINIDTVRRCKDGTEVDVSLIATPICVNGRQVAIQCIYRDIRDRKRLEAQLARSQRMEAVGRLAGGISHDFNNLLTVIQSTADLLFDSLPKGNPAREEVEEIARAAERAAGLTRQLLAFSKKQVLAPVVLDLNQCATDVVRMLRRLIGEDIEVVLSLQPGLGTVLADPSQMEQVLMNLAINARDAMPKGGKLVVATADVQLDARTAAAIGLEAGPFVEMRIEDTGCGIAKEIQDRIFEPFFSTKSETGRGTGLGLATVYGIVQQSHGAIELKSEVGVGSSFRVYLPRRRESADSLVAAQGTPHAAHAETVLVVEDDHAIRALVERSLAKAGYRVLTAASAAEAEQVASAHDGGIALLFTDVVMPGGNGPELAQRLQRARPGIRVLFTSGYANDKVFDASGTPEGAQFLAKPYSFSGLARKVREALDAR